MSGAVPRAALKLRGSAASACLLHWPSPGSASSEDSISKSKSIVARVHFKLTPPLLIG